MKIIRFSFSYDSHYFPTKSALPVFMFFVDHVYLSDDVALARFSCNIRACGGACCVQGAAGAPVRPGERAVLNKAWHLLKEELRPEAREQVETHGLVYGSGKDLELACVKAGACVFVEFDDDGTALCSIQKAAMEGRLNWPKPISCHLYPLRIMEAGGADYVNFEYVPDMCSTACTHARETGTYLAETLEEPLTRKYGADWYIRFLEACQTVRADYKSGRARRR